MTFYRPSLIIPGSMRFALVMVESVLCTHSTITTLILRDPYFPLACRSRYMALWFFLRSRKKIIETIWMISQYHNGFLIKTVQVSGKIVEKGVFYGGSGEMDQPTNARKLYAVSIATHRPEALADFYRMAFDLGEPKWKDKDHAGFELENIHLGIDRIKEESQNKAGGPVLWFRVANVEEAFTRLIDLGAKVRTNVTDYGRVGETVAVLFDPDGNLIGLIGPV
jgi:predicted enzyme related to lactoylglutathione lyase